MEREPYNPAHGTGFRPGIRPNDYRLGSVTGLPKDYINESGDWRKYAPPLELQARGGLETMACVTFSALNVIETLIYAKYGRIKDFSDRFTASMSGTGRDGNYLYAVGDSIRKDGLVDEDEYPWPSGADWGLYYKNVPLMAREQGKRFLERYKVSYEFVYEDWGIPLSEALKMAPLQVAIKYPTVRESGTGHYLFTGGPANHACSLMAILPDGGKWIMDHYQSSPKVLAPDYPIEYALRYYIELNNSDPEIMELKENHLYQLVDPPGGFGLAVGGKLIVEQRWELLASFLSRNSKDDHLALPPVIHLTKEQWDSVEHRDLKGNLV